MPRTRPLFTIKGDKLVDLLYAEPEAAAPQKPAPMPGPPGSARQKGAAKPAAKV